MPRTCSFSQEKCAESGNKKTHINHCCNYILFKNLNQNIRHFQLHPESQDEENSMQTYKKYQAYTA